MTGVRPDSGGVSCLAHAGGSSACWAFRSRWTPTASGFVILALLTLSIATDFAGLTRAYFPEEAARLWPAAYWVMGLAFFGCILLHELGHDGVARARGMPIRGITLFLFGAPVVRPPPSQRRAGKPDPVLTTAGRRARDRPGACDILPASKPDGLRADAPAA